jgi:hypothetical protein
MPAVALPPQQKGNAHLMGTQQPENEQRANPSDITGSDRAETTPDTVEELSLALIEEQADASIRRVWHKGRWFFSVIDLVGVLTDSTYPNRYWSDLKRKLSAEGATQPYEKIVRLKLRSPDGRMRETDTADTETLLRIIQSVPSPKAEPVKQWLARVGAQRVDEMTRPLDASQLSTERAALVKPLEEAPALVWAEYYEQLAVLYRRQAAYEAQLVYVDARLEEHEEQIGELHSRIESLEEGQRLLPELLERLGPQTLTPEHQATVKAMAKRLNELSGLAYATIYSDLNAAFHVGRYSDIPDAHWSEIATWFQQRLDAAQGRRKQ